MTFSFREPDFDTNLLEQGKSKRFAAITFTENEINKAIDFLSQFAQKKLIVNPAITLLHATYRFRCATMQQPFFVELRTKSKSVNELKKILPAMSDALSQAIHFSKTLDPDSKDYDFFNSVIHYCQESIKRRIKEMKNNHDEVYNYWADSQLKKLLTTDTRG